MKKPIAAIVLSLLVAASALAKPGDSKNLGRKEWSPVHGVTTVGGKLYVASGLTLLVATATGTSTDLYPKGSPDWGNPELLTSFEDKIYMMCDGKLYEVDPRSGKENMLGDGYRYTGGIAGVDGKLYVASDDALWLIDRKTKKYSKFTDASWYNVRGLTALDGKLYIISNDALSEVDTAGKITKFPATWPNVNGMTAANGKLYIFTDDPSPILYAVDKTGKGTAMPLPKGWDGTTGVNGMTALGSKLYLTMPNLGSTITLFTVETK